MRTFLPLVAIFCSVASARQEEVKCGDCGRPGQPGQKFCGDCGAKIETARPICAKCGTPGRPGQKFCGDCGGKLTGGSLASARLKSSVLLPTLVQSTVMQASVSCLQGVAFASRSAGTGRVVTTGTIRQSGRNLAWTNAPADRLKVELEDGRAFDFVVKAIDGDSTGTEFNFFRSRHTLKFTLSWPGTAEIEVSSERSGTDAVASVKGKMTFEQVEYDVEMKMTSGKNSQLGGLNDQGKLYGWELNEETVFEGRISAKEFAMTIAERHTVESVSHDGQSATASSRDMDNRWTFEGVEYRLLGRIQRNFKNQEPTRVDTYWQPKGGLQKGGKEYGALKCVATGSKVTVFLDVAGEKIELEVYGK